MAAQDAEHTDVAASRVVLAMRYELGLDAVDRRSLCQRHPLGGRGLSQRRNGASTSDVAGRIAGDVHCVGDHSRGPGGDDLLASHAGPVLRLGVDAPRCA